MDFRLRRYWWIVLSSFWKSPRKIWNCELIGQYYFTSEKNPGPVRKEMALFFVLIIEVVCRTILTIAISCQNRDFGLPDLPENAYFWFARNGLFGSEPRTSLVSSRYILENVWLKIAISDIFRGQKMLCFSWRLGNKTGGNPTTLKSIALFKHFWAGEHQMVMSFL